MQNTSKGFYCSFCGKTKKYFFFIFLRSPKNMPLRLFFPFIAENEGQTKLVPMTEALVGLFLLFLQVSAKEVCDTWSVLCKFSDKLTEIICVI